MKIEVEKIQEIFTVVGKITGAVVPHHQVVSQRKMENLEDSIEMLKKEMFNLNKKLQATRRN